MYTHCRIQWLDDQSEVDVIIKSTDELDSCDDLIFFYGLSPEYLHQAMQDHTAVENEWRVIDITEVSDSL